MRIGIVTRHDIHKGVELAGEITNFLIKEDVDVLLDPLITAELDKYSELSCELPDMDVDIIIAIGGDGTILRTQSLIDGKKIPVFGINMGTVGFLTEIGPEETFHALKEVLNGNYFIEERTRLEVWHNHDLAPALNEVVLMTRTPAKMLHIEIKVDDEIVEELRADGLIVATPSGSTAYSMSAGGPIVDPRVDAFIIVPICPFKLGSRPTVVSSKSIIQVRLLREGKKAIAVIDGQFEEEINYMEEIVFKKSDQCAYFVRLTKEFYKKVREKLMKGGIDSE
ncbi:MAG: NAD(+) kinase [Methanobacterium sp.]|uniref:NAD(+) kinase n=1 Tax=Methanobacterium sp. TaxID=2164 RepID=UPI003D64639F|nr:NAD(+) kinase [Methanobacterium sp.]